MFLISDAWLKKCHGLPSYASHKFFNIEKQERKICVSKRKKYDKKPAAFGGIKGPFPDPQISEWGNDMVVRLRKDIFPKSKRSSEK